MFERFTRPAREVVVRAREEAAALGHARVGSEHLLIGVATTGGLPAALGIDPGSLRAAIAAATGDGLDARALATIGIDLDAVRGAVEESFGPGALAAGNRSRPGRVPFGRSANRALERSLREALALRDCHIGPEHILLALVSEPSGGAAQALRSCGTSAEAVRAATLAARREAA